VRFGGNTPCVEVRTGDGGLLILDAGTGLRRLGAQLAEDGPLHVLVTHLHLDHVEGLRFFEPFWHADRELHIWGPPSPLHTLEERITRAFSPPLFPIELSDTPANVTFHDVPHEPWEIDGVRIEAQTVSHPGPTLGYRLSTNGTAIAYIPDHEPVLGVELAQLESEWISGHALAEDVDLLFHDCQFSESEYPSRVGWGHSSVAHAVEFAERADARQLVLFHHDPDRSDDGVDRIVERARELWRDESGDAPIAACEGMTVELG